MISVLAWFLQFCSLHAQETHWQCDIRDFQYDMTVYAQLVVDSVTCEHANDYELAAFSGEECRGVASVETIASTGQKYYYLRVRSNASDNEEISFKCYNRSEGTELELDTKVKFKSQAVFGVPSGLFSINGFNSYTVVYKIDGDAYKTETVKCGSVITSLVAPLKEGHTFVKWDGLPLTMPARNVVIDGVYMVNKYLVSFKIGDEVITSDSLEYGSNIIAPVAPEKEGHAFNGWGEVAETVPAYDVTYEGGYTVNSYQLTYVVDGYIVHTDSVKYGTDIVLVEEPIKEGYTFSGWGEVPTTMPAVNITVTGTFAVNTYAVAYIVDGEVVSVDSVTYGSEITVPAFPEKEGHTFSGWSEVPETMPANDVTITGSYKINSYAVKYVVDGVTVATDSVVYGTAVTLIDELEKEGYSFSWSEAPETMPANDITITGEWSINSYLVTYIIDGEVYATDSVEYGAAITLPEVPEKENSTFEWEGAPTTMPASDVTIYGNYVSGIGGITVSGKADVYTLNGMLYKRDVDLNKLSIELPKGVYIINGKKYLVK